MCSELHQREHCLQPVVNSGGTNLIQAPDGLHHLNAGQNYRFIYKTTQDGTNVNSLVAIHVSRLDLDPSRTKQSMGKVRH